MENNINWYAMNDTALLEWIGQYLRATRLKQNQTQQEVAVAAGVNRSTIALLEKGSGGTMTSLIQVLRALGQLDVLQLFQLDTRPSPMMLAEMEIHQRQRASRPKNDKP